MLIGPEVPGPIWFVTSGAFLSRNQCSPSIGGEKKSQAQVMASTASFGIICSEADPLCATQLLSCGWCSERSSMPEPVIYLDHLSRSFGTVKALDDLSLEVPAGIVFGFLGPNGAGKTTTIHLLLGLLEPTHGQARVLGFDTRTQADEIRARSGTLLEFAGLYERVSAEDNLDLYGRIYRMPAPARQARIKELLTHLDLWDRRRDLVGTWSWGMKRKLAVARALLHRPPLIFLDEPTAGLIRWRQQPCGESWPAWSHRIRRPSSSRHTISRRLKSSVP